MGTEYLEKMISKPQQLPSNDSPNRFLKYLYGPHLKNDDLPETSKEQFKPKLPAELTYYNIFPKNRFKDMGTEYLEKMISKPQQLPSNDSPNRFLKYLYGPHLKNDDLPETSKEQFKPKLPAELTYYNIFPKDRPKDIDPYTAWRDNDKTNLPKKP